MAVFQSRIDVSVRRLLRDKFVLGLFDNPYVDEGTADRIVGRADFKAAGEQAQRRSIVLLKNADTAQGKTLPLQGQPNLYVENVDPAVAGQVVQHLASGDLDRDGNQDYVLLVGNGRIEVRLGNGDGTFALGPAGGLWPAVGTTNPRRLAIGDLTGDGCLMVSVRRFKPTYGGVWRKTRSNVSLTCKTCGWRWKEHSTRRSARCGLSRPPPSHHGGVRRCPWRLAPQ